MEATTTQTTPAVEKPQAQSSAPVKETNTPQTIETAKLDAPSLLGGASKENAPVKEGEVTAEGDKPAEKPVIPEKYEFKLPDGFTIDEQTKGFIDTTFKELGIPADKAQALVDKHVEQFNVSLQAREAQAIEGWKAEVKGWEDVVKNDPILGGANFDATIAQAGKAVRTLLPNLKYGDQLLEFLDGGMGSNPAVVELFYYLGKMQGEDTAVKASTDIPAKPSFYPSMEKK